MGQYLSRCCSHRNCQSCDIDDDDKYVECNQTEARNWKVYAFLQFRASCPSFAVSAVGRPRLGRLALSVGGGGVTRPLACDVGWVCVTGDRR